MSEFQKKMCEKRKSEGGRVPSKRKWLTLEQKLDIIKLHEEGSSYANIGRVKGIDESSVRKLVKNKDKYKLQGMSTAFHSSKVVTKTRSSRMMNMERLLSIWIEDLNQKRVPLTQTEIQAKALSLYNDLKTTDQVETEGEGEIFKASRGWYFRFKQRTGIGSTQIGESSNIDKDAASKYPKELYEIIKKGGYKDNQIFNVAETGLFWKRWPSRTYIAENDQLCPGVSKDRLTVLLGGNTTGDFKLKPLLVYRAENPRALKGLSKNDLPVLWRSNKKAWVTKTLFEDWFANYFCPATEKYCKENELEHKILLILDHNLAFLTFVLNKNVQITFLPSNTNSLIQPLDQGVSATFKSYYLRRTFLQAIKVATGENAIRLTEFWKSYNIKNAIDNIAEAWNEVEPNYIKASWKNIIPHCSDDDFNFETHLAEVANNIVELGKLLGFPYMDSENVLECVRHNTTDLDNETLINIDEQQSSEREENLDNDECIERPTQELSAEQLGNIIGMVEKVTDHITAVDPNAERSLAISRTINDAILSYRELYADQWRNYIFSALEHVKPCFSEESEG